MKKRFTFLIAALMLLVFMTPSMVAWGQTRDEQTVSWTASSGALGSGIGTGTINTTGTYSWNYTRTLISGTSYTGWTSNCIQLGKNGGVENLTLSTSNIPGIIKSVSVECSSYGGYHKVSITVGGTTYLASTNTASWTTVSTKTGTGNSSGQIVVSFTNGSRALYIKSLSVTYEEGDATYTVTYNANGGTGTMTDSDSPYNAGATVTVLDNEFTRENYAFNHWNTAADDSGTDYDEGDEFTIDANTTLYAQWTENGGGGGSSTSPQELTFPFTSNISGWPTSASTTLIEKTYTLDNVDYTFALKNVYCNSGYLMLKSTAALGLPAIEGYKLTKVVAHNSTGCSMSTKVGISSSSSSASYITGGSCQIWTARDTDYTYNLSSTTANTMYYMYVTNANAQVTQLELTYEYVAPSTDPAINVDSELTVTPVAVANGELAVTYDNIEPTSGTITLYDAQDNDITESCTWFTPAFNADFSKVTYNATENISGAVNSVRMHLNISDGTDSAEADVAVTQDFILTTMDQILIRATANGSTEKDVTIGFNNWEVSDINNSNSQYATKAWLTDGTKGCVIFCTSSSYAKFKVNDKLNGTVNCKLKLYTGYAQISSLVSGNDGTTATPGLTVTNDGTPVNPVTGATIAGLSAVNTGSVVTLTNLVCQSESYNVSTGYILSDGTNTIRVKENTYSDFVLTQNSTYSVTGVFEYYSSNKYIYPRSSADINEVTSPVITVDASLSSFTYCEGEGPSAAQTITVSGSNLDGNITLALNDVNESAFEISLNNSDYTNTLTLTQTSGTVGETTIYVRMKAGLAIANDYADEINLNSTNATAKTVSLAGTVTPPVVTWDLTTNSYSSASATEVDWTSSYVNMILTKGTSGTDANNFLGGGSNNHTRFYKDQVLTITPVSGYAISSIVITAVSGYTDGFTGNTWTNATTETSGTTITVTPTNGNYACSVSISAACRATAVTVYYEESTLTPHNVTNVVDMVNGTVVANPSTAVAGATVTLYIYPAAGYYLESDSDIEVNGSSTITLTKVNDGKFTFVMPDEDVTVYAIFSAYSGTYYTLVNSTADLIPGRHYIIASSKDAGAAYAMGAQNGSYRDQVAVNVVGNYIYGTPSGLREVVLSGDNTNFWTLYDDGTGTVSKGYLYAGTGNALKCRMDNTSNNNGKWTISITEGVATIVSQISDTDVSNTIKHNVGSSRFSCYTPSSGMNLVYLYMKAGETNYELYSNTNYNNLSIGELDIYTVHSPAALNVTGTLTNEGNHENLIIEDGGQLVLNNTNDNVKATLKKSITAWDATKNEGWYTISSPIDGVSTGTLTEDCSYNLYQYNEPSAHWWGNGGGHEFNTLAKGVGYLYRRNNDATVSFSGTVNVGSYNTTLTCTSTLADNIKGFHLIGNPFAENISSTNIALSNNDEFTGGYVLTKAGSWEGTLKTTIKPCEGFLIQVAAERTITISKAAKGTSYNSDYIKFIVANSQYEDVTFALFEKAHGLSKIDHRNSNVPMLYIPQNNQNYAIAPMSDNTKSFNLNFKAMTTGMYTLRYDSEGEYNYLHIIDRLTGADVDMLLEGEYSFIGTPNDNENRFIVNLEYMPNYSEGNNEIFAFQSGNEILVSGSGELQIFDVTGRSVMTTTINGAESINLSAKGVYIFRLVGSEIKTQKIVVR